MAIKTNQGSVRSAKEVIHPVLNTSYKLKTAKRHYVQSSKSHRAQEWTALKAALDKLVRGSRSRETRTANANEVKRAVESMFRALNVKLS